MKIVVKFELVPYLCTHAPSAARQCEPNSSLPFYSPPHAPPPVGHVQSRGAGFRSVLRGHFRYCILAEAKTKRTIPIDCPIEKSNFKIPKNTLSLSPLYQKYPLNFPSYFHCGRFFFSITHSRRY